MGKTTFAVILQLCCLLACVPASTQVKNNVVKLHAYVQETVAGNVEVDSSGTQSTGVDVVHHVFAETTGKYLPQWNTVYTNRGVFAVQEEEIAAGKFNPGKLKSGSKAPTITAKRGNKLWRLELVPIKARIPEGVAELLKKNEMVVITEWKGEQFTHAVAREIELESIFYK